MSADITGGCLCGAVRFRFRAPPIATRACWCLVCQRIASGNATVNAYFRTETFEVAGSVAEHVRIADSGAAIRHRFCPVCGTQLFADEPGSPGVVAVRVGALDDPGIGRPGKTIWTGSKPDWGLVDPDAPSVAGHR